MPLRLHEDVGRSDYPPSCQQQGPPRAVASASAPANGRPPERNVQLAPPLHAKQMLPIPKIVLISTISLRVPDLAFRPPVGRSSESNAKTRPGAGNRLTLQRWHRCCGQALTAKLTANRSDSRRSAWILADDHKPFTCIDERQRTALDGRGRVRSPLLYPLSYRGLEGAYLGRWMRKQG